MESLRDRVVVITGAGSGIGRALAQEVAYRGANVAISDVNEEGLAETKAMVEKTGVGVFAESFDVSVRAAFEQHAANVVEEFGTAHVIVNNAGVSLRVFVEDMTYEDFEWLMDINFWGVVYGTMTFLPILQQNDWGHIVNISSVFGIVGIPTQSAYNASKFAVRGFTESLTMELNMTDSPVGVTSVHPGGIKTNIVRGGRVRDIPFEEKYDIKETFDKKMAITHAEDAGRQIADAIQKGKERLLIGPDARLIDIGQRLLPVAYKKIVQREAKKTYK